MRGRCALTVGGAGTKNASNYVHTTHCSMAISIRVRLFSSAESVFKLFDLVTPG